MSSPDLSVVMPMYNAEEWVGEAIERIETRKLIYGRSGDQPSDE